MNLDIDNQTKNILFDMIKNEMIQEFGNNKFSLSEKFVTMMECMQIMIQAKLDNDSALSNKCNKVFDEYSNIQLDGLIVTTIVHFHKFHLNKNTLKIPQVEEEMNIIKLFYKQNENIKYDMIKLTWRNKQ